MKVLKKLLAAARCLRIATDDNSVVVYTGRDCACSNTAVELITSEGMEPIVRLLDDYPEARREYGGATPIVVIDGRMRFVGRVDPVLLKRLADHRRRVSKRD